MRRGGRIPSGVARQKDIMMKRDTHEGEQERVVSAQCEPGVKAQSRRMASARGRHAKGEGEETETQFGLFFSPVPQRGRANNTDPALPHTTVLTQRQLCSRGCWENGARSFKELRRRVNSQEQQIEKQECGLWAVAQVASGFRKCLKKFLCLRR